VLVDDRSFGLVALDVRDGLMLIGIERLAERIDRLEPFSVEDRAQLFLDEPHALDPR
jgi:hypothetical protein